MDKKKARQSIETDSKRVRQENGETVHKGQMVTGMDKKRERQFRETDGNRDGQEKGETVHRDRR